MTADTPERPDMSDDMSDDIARAYAQSHALADDGRGPSAAVRANVLAVAREIAAESASRIAVEQAVPFAGTQVAPPVAEVGRRRAAAVNLSSWRVRSGAALCAVLLVGMVSWRFDSAHRLSGDVQVALAELKLAAPPTAAPPQELPAPALSAASTPQAPLPTVDDPLARSQGVGSANGKPSVREPDLVIAQADSRERVPLPQVDVLVRAQRAPAPAEAKQATAAPPVSTERFSDAAVAEDPPFVATAPPFPAPAPAPTSNAAPAPPNALAAAAAPQIMTASPMPPSVVPRRYALAPHAPSAPVTPERETTVAAQQADGQRIEIAGSPPFSSAPLAEALRKVSPPPGSRLVDASARLLPGPLQSAAEQGDVEALQRLLADPATRVDALDSSGRTALLHAVLAQRVEAVRRLLLAGADPDRADASGLTPRAAAQAGSNAAIAAAMAASPR